MRMTSALKLLSLLACSSAVACADVPESQFRRHNVPVDAPAGEGPAAAPGDATAPAFTVTGHVSSEGSGSVDQGLAGAKLLAVAHSVDVLALGANGELSPVTSTDVKPGGAFTTLVPTTASPTGIFILKVKDVAGAIVGSGIVNGLPAFLNAFFIDATIDTATSFKTEILVTLAKKGIPGVQNYLNVIDAYVDAQLANSIAVAGVFSTDLTTLIGATSDAIIAAEEAIVEGLKKAGIPVDLSALEKAQAAAVSGVQGLVTSSTGSLIAASKNLVASLEAATAKAAAPIDQAIFNAIVSGGATFASTFKKSMPTTTFAGGAGTPDIALALSKAVFSLETALTTASVTAGFKHNAVATSILDAVTSGCAKFEASVASASSVAELEAAKSAFTKVLVGGPTDGGLLAMLATTLGNISAVLQGVDATLAPLAKNLTAAFATLDEDTIGEALASFDAATSTELPSKLKAAVRAEDAAAIASALRLVQKQVVL